MLGYVHHLTATGRDRRHVRQTVVMVGKALRAIGARRLADVTRDALERYLGSLRLGKSAVSPRTYNGHLAALRAFYGWALGKERSPVTGIQALDVSDDECRWPLSVAEATELLQTTEQGPRGRDGKREGGVTRFGMEPAERALCYRVALETAYRADELRSLTAVCFDLGDAPTVRLLSRHAKSRRGARCFPYGRRRRRC